MPTNVDGNFHCKPYVPLKLILCTEGRRTFSWPTKKLLLFCNYKERFFINFASEDFNVLLVANLTLISTAL